MNQDDWLVTFVITRQRSGKKPYDQAFSIEVNPDEYVLDVIERIWAYQDRSLTYRHACHHSTCGACGMLINGVEKLTCITSIRSITHNGGTVRVAPLRNFPVISDLVIDMSEFFSRLEAAHAVQVVKLGQACLPYEQREFETQDALERLVDCIECGLCISACPSAHTSANYSGPAVLAAIHQAYQVTNEPCLLDLADNEYGAWRCHSAYECAEVCPSNVNPAWRIMNLRKRILSNRIKQLLSRKSA